MAPVRPALTLLLLLILPPSLLASIPFPRCSGSATYNVTFINQLTPERFGDRIPPVGLVFSPMVAVSHSNRLSFLTVRGLASPQVEQIAETGDNSAFVALATSLQGEERGVLTVADAPGPTMSGGSTSLMVEVDCENPFITALSMIAPSPDWIVQVNNRNMVDRLSGDFVTRMSGILIAYDAGVDDGMEFTPPMDLSLDLPTVPPLNIAPLVEDDTDRFNGRHVGRFIIMRM
eukprot:GFKZ01012039.1.p1 GENE.GFKZ01012039.1~~GFKZ01012039.1.p1  ORF type:complete len:245 (+),score=31.57 GFKZ01012039.1:42-737(+)